jgi:2-oxoglutarate ferredoxin oxidoreductase subunit alpha
MMIAERAQNILKPNPAAVPVETREVYRGTNGYERYDGASVSPMPVPGGPGSYVANASEHDPRGDTTHLPHRHVQMTERRFAKLSMLEDGTYESKNNQNSVALFPWGGSKGPAEEAYPILLQQGVNVAWYYTMFLNPLPPALLEELRSKDLVIVPELNYMGQLSSVLRGLGVNAESITQYTGLPFKVRDLVERVTARVEAYKGEKVTA